MLTTMRSKVGFTSEMRSRTYRRKKRLWRRPRFQSGRPDHREPANAGVLLQGWGGEPLKRATRTVDAEHHERAREDDQRTSNEPEDREAHGTSPERYIR